MKLVEMGYSTDDTCLPYRLITFILKQHCKQIIGLHFLPHQFKQFERS